MIFWYERVHFYNMGWGGEVRKNLLTNKTKKTPETNKSYLT